MKHVHPSCFYHSLMKLLLRSSSFLEPIANTISDSNSRSRPYYSMSYGRMEQMEMQSTILGLFNKLLLKVSFNKSGMTSLLLLFLLSRPFPNVLHSRHHVEATLTIQNT